MGVKRSVLILMIMLACGAKVSAGGFPVRPGSLSVSVSVTSFYAGQRWDSLRVKRPFDQNGHFQSINYSLYAELGLSRRFSLVVMVPYVTSTYQQTGLQVNAQGVTDVETGLKYYLANINYRCYFSLQATAISPMYTDVNLGFKESGGELKLSVSGKGKIGGNNFYYNVDNAARLYIGSAGPFQYRYNGAFGLALDKNFTNQISLSAGGSYSTSTLTTFSPNQATNRNFSFDQVGISYGLAFSRHVSLFLSASEFIIGRNTGVGSSLSGALILKPF